jgi:hypothetical protein
MGASLDAAEASGEFNTKISKARTAYFAATTAKAKAEARTTYAALLRQKDMMFAAMMLSTGPTDAAWQRTHGAMILAGGALDGGILTEVVPAFNTWLWSVRSHYGVARATTLLTFDADRLRNAIKAAEPDYARYAAARDKAELQRRLDAEAKRVASIDLAKRSEAAVNPDGSLKLDHQKIEPMSYSHWISSLDTPELRTILLATMAQGQQIINCNYGPIRANDGSQDFEKHSFWYPTAPPKINEMLAMDRKGAVGYLRSASTGTCPINNRQAAGLRAAALHPHWRAPDQRQVHAPPTNNAPRRGRDAERAAGRPATTDRATTRQSRARNAP